MNLETILKCAETTARHQMAGLGYVTPEVQELIAEVESLLAPAPVVEDAPKTKKTKAAA
jgi:hypothetical protein